MKLYISGGISNIPNYKEHFNHAHQLLLQAGYHIEDPTAYGFTSQTEWITAMKYDLTKMLTCDGIALLDDWQNSRGSCCEVKLAIDMKYSHKKTKRLVAIKE